MANNGRKAKWNPEQLARALGWLSIGLGVAEILAPRGLGRFIGVKKEHRSFMRLMGIREIASGIGILSQRNQAGWVWSRVGGDALDLALLGASMSSGNPYRGRLAAATAAVAGVAAVDLFCSKELSRNAKAGDGSPHVEKSITINRTPEELYAFWRDFQNLPRFMDHLVSVQVIDSTRSHWVAKAPLGTTVQWDAEIISDRPNEVIAWRSLEGADVDNAGSVRFEKAPGERGTIIHVKIQYRPMGGAVAATVAKFLGQAPEKQLTMDLYRFKQLMETGEVARTEGQPAGRAQSTSRKYDDVLRS